MYVKQGEINLMTNEGPAAVQECIDFLKSAEKCPPLEWNGGMAKASKDHCDDTGPKGTTGHTGSDGSSPGDRVKKYVDDLGMSGENISYGCNTAEDIVLQLIVDDGVASRGHRSNIFNKGYNMMGCHVGEHK